MKYEAVFGDQSLFFDAHRDCEMVGNGHHKVENGKLRSKTMTQREELNADQKKINWLLGLEKETLADMAHQQSKIIERFQKATKAQIVPEWIPVSDRLPQVGERCLFYRPLAENSGDDVISVKTAIPDGKFCWDNTVPDGETPCNPSNGACHVTHWMPLPPAPEQNK